MIARCYYPNNVKYRYYGGDGAYVCDRWKRLDFFIEDMPNIPGYDYDKFMNSEIELDKDIKGNGNKIYSPETCCFVTHADNVRESNRRKKIKNMLLKEKCNDYPKGVGDV